MPRAGAPRRRSRSSGCGCKPQAVDCVSMNISAGGTFYGRTPEQWGDMVRTTTTYLQQRARGRGHTSYTDVNNCLKQRLGHGFDFDLPSERHALGYLLADVNEGDDPAHQVMLSAIVSY